MAISSNLERMNYGSPDGSVATGVHRETIQSVGATKTLTAAESGALCLFDSATGVVFTLPTPVAGMQFEFNTTVAVTSNAYKIVTSAATEFIVGGVLSGELTATMDVFQADGTTIRALSSNGSTTGGLIGSRFKVTAISATQWVIDGVIIGSGVLADPFATS